MTTTVRIRECTDPTELYHRYDNEFEAQPCYIELDLRHGTLHAAFDAEIGGAVPFSVHYGLDRRYRIPTLTAEAANRTMREIAPMAERILADWEEKWDGSNFRARLGEDAQAAEEAIIAHLRCGQEDEIGPDRDQGFDPDDLVQVFDIDSAITGDEVAEYGITADTTDARLEEIEADILTSLQRNWQAVVLDGVGDYLRQERDDLATDDPLTDAEIRAAREELGLKGDDMARLLGVNPRTLRSWEQGRDPIPGPKRPKVAELREDTDKAVAALAARVAGQEAPELTTYRNDDEYQAAAKAGQLTYLDWPPRWSASWHRRVCTRVAAHSGARIVYSEENPTEDQA